jgi:hypothetical protein
MFDPSMFDCWRERLAYHNNTRERPTPSRIAEAGAGVGFGPGAEAVPVTEKRNDAGSPNVLAGG